MSSAQQSLPSVGPVDAFEQLSYIEVKRAAGRRAAAAIWFPLLVGGIASLAAPTTVDLIGGAAAPGWYWGVTGPLIGISCGLFYALRPVHLPVRIAATSVVIAFALVTGALLTGFLVGDSRAGTPVLVVAAGLGAFALLYRSRLVAVVAGANLVAAIVLLTGYSSRTEEISYLATGLVSCLAAITAISSLRSERPPA